MADFVMGLKAKEAARLLHKMADILAKEPGLYDLKIASEPVDVTRPSLRWKEYEPGPISEIRLKRADTDRRGISRTVNSARRRIRG